MAFKLIDIALNLDKYLQAISQQHPTTIYFILFMFIFMETGLIITPFLPGDSLLFAVGAIAASGFLNIKIIFFTILMAAIIGDTVNYHVGKFIGPKVFHKENSFLFHKEHLIRSKLFYEKYGGKTIILARFIPIIRTFAPFVAGIGAMSYARFLMYNVIGALFWCTLFILGGYVFGNIPLVKDNFNIIILLIIFISIIPLIKEIIV